MNVEEKMLETKEQIFNDRFYSQYILDDWSLS